MLIISYGKYEQLLARYMLHDCLSLLYFISELSVKVGLLGHRILLKNFTSSTEKHYVFYLFISGETVTLNLTRFFSRFKITPR